MSTPLSVRLFYGVWRHNDDGYWIFQRKPSDLGYTVLIKPTETFEDLETRIRERYKLKTETPLSLSYHPPEWMLEPKGTRTPPTTIARTSDVEAMMHLSSWFAELKLCFLTKTTFSIGGATFVFSGLLDRELVASKEVLEEILNVQELVGIYRAHLEIEKAKRDLRENGASCSGSAAPVEKDDSGSYPFGSDA
ncbi:hypothetical protein Bca4012_065818 [Brassica carinata]|uniref:Uncharacterized protein n=1 Tax=Brassica carinata TaxID=52824 RepID=A0A8X7VQB9_BRACI|nr:hypothetical protein Bca52824_018137 [Brassica carinata]